ncbi:unnamed protein product [Ectocarpus sp. 6 AP-2014]
MMLKRDMEESFCAVGLDASARSREGRLLLQLLRGDIVDVELYSASCEILKAGVTLPPRN